MDLYFKHLDQVHALRPPSFHRFPSLPLLLPHGLLFFFLPPSLVLSPPSLNPRQEESAVNKKDAAELRGVPVFHTSHGSAIAAMKDINSYFDKLSAVRPPSSLPSPALLLL
jgi:hypothetical protein